MKAVVRFVRKWWWLALLALAAIGYVLARMLTSSKYGHMLNEPGIHQPPPRFIEIARDKVEKVHLEGEIEKAKVRTVAEQQIKQLEAIEEVGKTDPKRARKDLAAFLATSL